MELGPIRVFDSRKARNRYKNYKEYRSSDIIVPPGYLGLVEVIAPVEYLEKMTFSAVRIPTPQGGDDSDCFNECELGKRYRRWRCTQELGDHRSPNMRPTAYTGYNQHIVYWGFDPFIDRIVEFEWIDRPGTYYLEANRCENDVLNDCDNPTLIEFSLIKWYPSYSPLDLPGICEVRRNRQMDIGGTPYIPKYGQDGADTP